MGEIINLDGKIFVAEIWFAKFSKWMLEAKLNIAQLQKLDKYVDTDGMAVRLKYF